MPRYSAPDSSTQRFKVSTIIFACLALEMVNLDCGLKLPLILR